MADPMDVRDPAERSMNAGEYALGTLSAQERREFEKAAAADATLRHELHTWERRLAALALKLEPVAPRPLVWIDVSHRTAGAPAPRADSRATSLWAAFATAASIVLAFGWYRDATQPPAPPKVERVEVPVVAQTYVALLQVPASNMRWSVSVVPDKNTFVVRAEGDVPAAARKLDAELWLIADGKPVSLGVIPKSGESRYLLPKGVSVGAGGTLAVSLEPIGGSITGQPTGPVVTTATVMQAS
jgi:anti-sigma-K factor RskA